MSKISDAVHHQQRWCTFPEFDFVVAYVVDGDDKALSHIKPTNKEYGFFGLLSGLRSPDEWQEEDRRLVRAMAALRADQTLGYWIDGCLQNEKQDQRFYEIFSRELHGFSRDDIAAFAVQRLSCLTVDGHPSSAGHFILGLSDADLRRAVKQGELAWGGLKFVELLCGFAIDKVPLVVDDVLAEPRSDVCAILLVKDAPRYEAKVYKAFKSLEETWPRFLLAEVLYDHDPGKYRDEALSAARAALAGSGHSNNHGPVAQWLIAKFGEDAISDLVKYLRQGSSKHWSVEVVKHASSGLGSAAAPVFLAGAEDPEQEVRVTALKALIALHDPSLDTVIQKHIETGLAPDPVTWQGKGNEDAVKKQTQKLLDFVSLATQWDVRRVQELIWPLLEHKSKQVRDHAARALATMGDFGIEKASELLEHKKADVRLAAAMLLATSGTTKAIEAMEARVDSEDNDDVRDEILAGLQQVWERQGRKITRKDIKARVSRSAGKLAKFPVAWLEEGRMPRLRWKEGGELSPQEVRYLLYRQSRAKEMAPDTEARDMYPLIDRTSSGDFAKAVLNGFLGSGADAQDRWAMTVSALVGDDRIVPILIDQIRQWVDSNRGKLAEYAVQALALQGSDLALLAVDTMAIRYRNKMKNVGRAAAEAFATAAQAQGISPEELGDRVVPWLGFEPGRPRTVCGASGQFEVSIGMDLKFAYRDLTKNKPVKSLPKSVPAEALAELKELSASLKEVAKAQTTRMENLLVRQRQWTVSRWRELFLNHPVLVPFAVRLVWGEYGADGRLRGTFRVLEDRTLTASDDKAFSLGDDGTVSIIHPLELTEQERSGWQKHLADYQVEPPFPQMGREVVCVPKDQEKAKAYKDLAGTKLNAMTFKGRAERLGWHRGSVCDAGGVNTYMKSFPAAGADVLLGVDGFYVGIDMYAEVTLGEVRFVHSGSVKTGSYVYDEPTGDDDPRVLEYSQVPPIVFSEVMGDVKKIAGQAAAQDDD